MMAYTAVLGIITIAVLAANINSTSTKQKPKIQEPCMDGWFPFRDQSCFKLFKTYSSWEKAAEVCRNEYSENDPFVPKLATIKSRDEQSFLTNLIFDTLQVDISVWLGGSRQNDKNEFVWTDGSALEFKHWAEDNPSATFDKNCIEMSPGDSRSEITSTPGVWKNVVCNRGNYVLCQKEQAYSMGDLVRMVLELKRKPGIPVGFIYTQLPGQSAPELLWPDTQWQSVSSNYSGLFFRTEGNPAGPFDGSVQNDFSSLLNRVEVHANTTNNFHWSDNVIPGSWTKFLWTGSNSGSYHHAIRFNTSSGETRPKNTAVRIWKRIG